MGSSMKDRESRPVCGMVFGSFGHRHIMRCIVFPAYCLTLALNAQWQPDGVLLAIPRVDDCATAGPDHASGRQADKGYVIHTCERALADLDAATPGARHFFEVRAYCYRAMGIDTEEAADVWTASALAQAPNAAHYLNAAIAHLRKLAAQGDAPNPGGAKPSVRAQRVQEAAAQIAKLAGLALAWNAEKGLFE